MTPINLQDIINQTGVKFGTSGVRALADSLTDFVCYSYTKAFLQYLECIGDIKEKRVAIASDRRPSSPKIMIAVGRCLRDCGYEIVNCGIIPTAAVSFYGFQNNIPSIMVTGSHIPFDRNGIKFNKSHGEILKEDEGGIYSQVIEIDEKMFDEKGSFVEDGFKLPEVSDDAKNLFLNRYKEFFPKDFFAW